MTVRSFLVRALMIWGAFSFLCVLTVIGYVAYRASTGNEAEIDKATSYDVRFVLNWCALGADRIERVVHSYVSPRNITGDHVDAYAIKISRLELSELTKQKELGYGRWYRADDVPPVLDNAIQFMAGWLSWDGLAWFPPEAAMRTSEFYVYPWKIQVHGTQTTAAQLIFIRPSDKMVFYFSGKS